MSRLGLGNVRSPSEEVPFIVSGQKSGVWSGTVGIAADCCPPRWPWLLCASEIQSAALPARNLPKGTEGKSGTGTETRQVLCPPRDTGLTRTVSQYEDTSIGKQAMPRVELGLRCCFFVRWQPHKDTSSHKSCP